MFPLSLTILNTIYLGKNTSKKVPNVLHCLYVNTELLTQWSGKTTGNLKKKKKVLYYDSATTYKVINKIFEGIE